MERVIITVMCMVYNKQNNEVLMINRLNDWPGYTFPGGHVEAKEPVVEAVIREMKEETGYDILNPKLIGIRQWYEKNDDTRNLGLLFMTTSYTGNILSKTSEGSVSWIKVEDLDKIKLAEGFKKELPLFFESKWTEIFSMYEENENKYKFL